MGIKDVAQFHIEQNPEVFAELFNKGYFGVDVISPKNLSEFPSVHTAIMEDKNVLNEAEELQNNKSGLQSIKRYRDIAREAVVKQDDKFIYIVLGIENQSTVDPYMVRRVMNYDSLAYEQQEKDWKNNGCKGTFKYKPVHTLVVNFSGKEWTAPTSLHEMMDLKGWPEYLFPNDYKIKVLDPAKITPEKLEEYQLPLREAWELLRRAPIKREMLAYAEENQEVLDSTEDDFHPLYITILETRLGDLLDDDT